MMSETITLQKIKLPNGKEIILNDQQTEALSRMKTWLEIEGDCLFTLSGYAGTGKTTITLELINHFYKKFPHKNIYVSAPTHKAKKIISKATEEDAYTIQKLLGLRPNVELETYDINNPQFDPLAEKAIKDCKLVVIDEASMLNESLFKLLMIESEKFKTKILFMGDDAQLPPVNENISRIFTDVPNIYRLTKVERQADSNSLMLVYDAIRSNIRSNRDLFSHETKMNEKGEGIVFHSEQKDFEAQVLPLFSSEEYKKDSDFVKLITYTNASVKAWNNHIRNYIFNNPPKPIVKGEVLFAYNSVIINRTEVLIENSSDYRVHNVKETVSRFGIDIYEVIIRSVDEDKKSKINIVRESGIAKFLIRFNSLLNSAKSAKGPIRGKLWKNYYDFKNLHLLLENITLNGVLQVKKDLDYGYAITTHKSQGSTFTNVAVSENNLDRNESHEKRNKLKYVAFSRPTQKVIVFSNKAK